MNDLGSWLQDNWYDLGTLLTLIAFLLAGVWFARNFLKTLATFQQQLGALVKVSPAVSAQRAVVKNPSVKETLAEGISSWLQSPVLSTSEAVAEGPSRMALAGARVFSWLQTPTHAMGAAPLRRMVRWFQAPIGS